MSGARRGACPTVHAPMQSGDGLLVRVKPGASPLSAASARVVAKAAERFGNGVIELTRRANLQVRGLTATAAPRFAEAMVAAGLAHPDPGVERRRNLIVAPLAGWDASAHPATLVVARLIEAELADPALDGLPDKFGFVVDGGGVLPLDGLGAHVVVRLSGDGASVESDTATTHCAVNDASARALAAASRAAVTPRPSSPDSFRRPTDRTGGGASAWIAGTSPATTVGDGPAMTVGESRLHTLTPAFGQFHARDLAVLAAHAPDGLLRLTPWKTILLAGATGAPPDLSGWISDPADPRLRVTACPGAPACSSATVPARAAAGRIAGAAHVPVHVSGCAKGCAQSGAAPVTLIGRDGRYDLVRNGRAADPPLHRGLTLERAVALIAGIAA